MFFFIPEHAATMNRNTHRKTFRNPPLGLLLHLVLLYGLFVDVIGSSDDITNIWYYGCRWFGGNAMTLQCNCTPEAEEVRETCEKSTFLHS